MDGKFAELTAMLVNMAMPGKKKDLDTLNAEIADLTSEISRILSELSEYKNISDEKYINNAGMMQDQIFSNQLNSTIVEKQKELVAYQKELDELKEQENSLHEEIQVFKNSISLAEQNIAALQSRMAEIQNDEIKTSFKKTIAKIQTDKKDLEKELEQKNGEQIDVQNKIETLAAKIDGIKASIEANETRLEEIREKLKSNDAYIDKNRQQKDVDRKNILTQELDELETKKAETMRNPVYLANQAVVAHLDEDPTAARKICEEIANIATTKNPYLNEPNKVSLKEALVVAEEDRNSFLANMDGKTYEASDSNTVIEIRTEYLNRRIVSEEQKIGALQAEILDIDLDQKYGTEADIAKIETVIANGKENLKRYEELLQRANNEDFEDQRKLQAAYERMKKEMKKATAICEKYAENRLADLNRITAFKNDIKSCEEKIEQYKMEIAALEKEKVLNGANAKDALAELEDRRILNEKIEAVMNIKASLNFAQTPAQVLSQIDQILGIVVTPTTSAVEEKIAEAPQEPASTVVEETKEEVVEPILEREETAELVPNAEEEQKEVNENLAFQPAFGQGESKVEEQQVETPLRSEPKQEPAQTVTVNKEQIVDNLANTGSIPVQDTSKKKVTQTEEVAVQSQDVVEKPQESVVTEKIEQPLVENKTTPSLTDFLNAMQNNSSNSNMTEFFQSNTDQEEKSHQFGA